MGLQGMVPIQQQIQYQISLPQMVEMQQSGQGAATVQAPEQGHVFMQKSELGTTVMNANSDNHNYTEEDVKKYEMEPELNELLDFSFCGD